MTWNNRIVGYGDEQPDQLCANPRNWRIHPETQQKPLLGVLETVGVVQNVIVNKRTGFVVDGHLRIALALRTAQPSIPVTYVDLDESEEALILASLDPLAALAAADAEQLDALLREVSTSDAAVMQMLSDLAEANGVIPTDWSDAMGALPDGEKAPFEQMTFTVSTRQAETIREAMAQAKRGGITGTDNENSNGNALAAIAEAYLNAA